MKQDICDLDAARAFLKVSRSTLLRWIRDGRVPARKLGGQWRFARADLQALRDGRADAAPKLRARESLRAFLTSRKDTPVNSSLDATPSALAEALVWNAHDRKASDLHLQPRRDGVHIAFRLRGRLETVRVIPPDLAAELEAAWNAVGRPFGDSGIRRIFLSRDSTSAANEVSVVSQAVDTLQGRRVTLHFMGGGRVADLETIAPLDFDRATLESWLSRPNGVVLFAGLPGSGKTTTLLSCLQHLAKNAAWSVFSLEYPAYLRVDGVDQVEVPDDLPSTVTAALQRIGRMYPNAVGLCLETAETAKFAVDFAAAGHLLLMQIEAEGHEAAVKRFEQMAGRPAGANLIGVISQKLRSGKEGGLEAEYKFWEAPRAG